MEQPVVIQEYTSDWQSQFEEEKSLIQGIMKEQAIAIEHIGSTSVEGLAAKPIIDFMVGVKDLNQIEHWIDSLAKIGYEYVHHQHFPDRKFFRKGQWRAGTHHLHVYEYQSDSWKNQLLFRDFLRTHPETRERYQQLKKYLADQHQFDRVAYTNAKGPFIEEIIRLAKETR